MSLIKATRRSPAPPAPTIRSGPRGLGPLAAPAPRAHLERDLAGADQHAAAAPALVELDAVDEQQVADDAAAAGCWSFTERARAAMDALHLGVAEVIEVLDAPATVRPSRRHGALVATRRGLMVVHDRAGRCVLSVVREHQGQR